MVGYGVFRYSNIASLSLVKTIDLILEIFVEYVIPSFSSVGIPESLCRDLTSSFSCHFDNSHIV